MDERVKKDVYAAGLDALFNAREQHGDFFVSSHEGYAVLKEEVEGAADAMEEMEKLTRIMWEGIKHDMNRDSEDADKLLKQSAECAGRCCEVMAVCSKIMESAKLHNIAE